MSSSNSTALTKRSASSGLMLPPPAPKRIKRPSVVLDEDTYTSAISHIVRRDFYPGLAEADAQREYLNAVESKDKAWIREAGKNLTQVMTPVPHGKRRGIAERTRFDKGWGGNGDVSKTPSVWGSDTPVSATGTEAGAEEENDEGLGKLNKVDLNMSLGAFQARYTSEDQESFSKIIDTQNQKRFDKNKWLYDGNRYASKQRIAQQKAIEAAKSESKELVLSNRPSQNLDDRPAGPNMHKHTAFNSLMFRPDGVEDWAPTRAQAMENASLAPPKQVRYNNTRLPEPHESAPARPSSPTLSAIRDAVAGRPRLTPSEGGYTGSETPRVNGYAFVDAHPPTADSDSDSESAPTDLLEKFGVDANSKATPFTINDSSRREKLHHKMVERIGVKQRLGTSNTLSSSSSPSSMKGPGTGSGLGIFTSETPRFLSAPTPARRLAGNQTSGGGKKNMGNLTPAAQRLFERVGGGTPRGVTSGGFGEQGKGGKEWTPTPRVRRKA